MANRDREITQAALQVIQFTEKLHNPAFDTNKYKWTIDVLNEAARLETENQKQFRIMSEGTR